MNPSGYYYRASVRLNRLSVVGKDNKYDMSCGNSPRLGIGNVRNILGTVVFSQLFLLAFYDPVACYGTSVAAVLGLAKTEEKWSSTSFTLLSTLNFSQFLKLFWSSTGTFRYYYQYISADTTVSIR